MKQNEQTATDKKKTGHSIRSDERRQEKIGEDGRRMQVRRGGMWQGAQETELMTDKVKLNRTRRGKVTGSEPL